MSADQNNPDQDSNEKDGNTSQSQNNNGNIGREVDEEREGTGSFKDLSRNLSEDDSVNENGVGENEENHWTGNHGQRSSNRPGSSGSENFNDRNLSDAIQQNEGKNHVTNVGGTSQEDLEKGKIGLRDQEDKK